MEKQTNAVQSILCITNTNNVPIGLPTPDVYTSSNTNQTSDNGLMDTIRNTNKKTLDTRRSHLKNTSPVGAFLITKMLRTLTNFIVRTTV